MLPHIDGRFQSVPRRIRLALRARTTSSSRKMSQQWGLDQTLDVLQARNIQGPDHIVHDPSIIDPGPKCTHFIIIHQASLACKYGPFMSTDHYQANDDDSIS